MRSEPYGDLRAKLLKSGARPRYVERTILELREHFADLYADALAAGRAPAEAERLAAQTLGSEDSIAAAVLARPELLSFSTRWPRVALCLRSAAAIGALPGMPVLYCLEHRPEIMRWSAALGGALALVGSILAWLDYMILVT